LVFEQRLGSMQDKSLRVGRLAAFIAGRLGQAPEAAVRAAELAKCDLLTEVVGEFPQLQGVMGRYHALRDGEPEAVADALDQQYMPRHAGDALPGGITGRILSLADRLDTLVGIFAIDQAPTGEKDPFALRRAALGCLRILIECDLDLDLHDCLAKAAAGYGADVAAAAAVDPVFDFMMERLRRYYLDDGTRSDVFDAVLARRPTRPRDFDLRIRAVAEFRALPEAESLAAANKRIRNILRQAGGGPDTRFDAGLLNEPAERELASAMAAAAGKIQPLLARSDYTAALARLAALRGTVDAFFDQVMVMCDDEALRRNRLALLNELSDLFLMSADISLLQST
jgi:glycyl-tRNA synthetase beta chain